MYNPKHATTRILSKQRHTCWWTIVTRATILPGVWSSSCEDYYTKHGHSHCTRSICPDRGRIYIGCGAYRGYILDAERASISISGDQRLRLAVDVMDDGEIKRGTNNAQELSARQTWRRRCVEMPLWFLSTYHHCTCRQAGGPWGLSANMSSINPLIDRAVRRSEH